MEIYDTFTEYDEQTDISGFRKYISEGISFNKFSVSEDVTIRLFSS